MDQEQKSLSFFYGNFINLGISYCKKNCSLKFAHILFIIAIISYNFFYNYKCLCQKKLKQVILPCFLALLI